MPDNIINEINKKDEINKLISKILKNLKLSITDNIFKDLCSLGEMLRQPQEPQEHQLNSSNKVEKIPSLTKDQKYRDSFERHIQQIIDIDKDNSQNITQTTPEQISNLMKLFIIWKGNFFESRNKYQSYKDKNNIPKEDRYNIYSAIFALCYTACHLNSKAHPDPAFKKFDNSNILCSLKTLNNNQKKISSSLAISSNKVGKQEFLKEIEEIKADKQALLQNCEERIQKLLEKRKKNEEIKEAEHIIKRRQKILKDIEEIKELEIETQEFLKKAEEIKVIVVRIEKFIQKIEARVQELQQEVKGVNSADEQEQEFLKKIEVREQELLNEIKIIELIKQECLKEIKDQEQGLLKEYEEKKHELLEKIERQEQGFLQRTEEQELEFLKKIKEEIAGYIPPSKTKIYQAIKISSIVLAIIVALTAGLATGGAIYPLIVGSIGLGGTILGILVAVVGGLVAVVSGLVAVEGGLVAVVEGGPIAVGAVLVAVGGVFIAVGGGLVAIGGVLVAVGGGLTVLWAGVMSNYKFFSSTLPEFFRMVARGELTQYTDKKTEKRERMSGFKKFLLGFAFIFALSVGVVSAALLVGSIMSLLALMFPFLGPTVLLILGGVLGLCYGIALTITMFYAFVKALKNPLSSSEIKHWLANLTLNQVLGYIIKGVLIGLVFFGIGFGCQMSIDTLVTLLSAAFRFISVSVISTLCIGLGVVSFIGQVPFAVLSVNKFCNAMAGFFKNLFHSSQNSQELKSCGKQEKCENRFLSILKAYLGITVNALGNATLVVNPGSKNSIVAAGGAGFYSFSGNMLEPMSKEEQEACTKRDEFITQYRFGSTEIRSSEHASSETETNILTAQFGKQSYSLFILPQESTINENNNEKDNIDDNISLLSHK